MILKQTTKALFVLVLLTVKIFASDISFTRDVRPILSSKCFFCHGPAEKSRKAKLRLDLEKEAFKQTKGIAAFVKNSLRDSEAWHRINSKDPEEVMPPPEFKKELSQKEIETLRLWIIQGAKWEDHWSYHPIKKPSLPKPFIAEWIRNPIDQFVLSTLEKNNLRPSPEATQRTLVRRLHFDLTGLPPTHEEIHSYLLDHSPSAYEKVVDRLLHSEAYAERMTLIWMDASRYGDTSVFHDDGPRDMWPWRDWVLNAYKNNMPFDRFTIEQLAGDLLPEASDKQKIASGFNRNHATTDEGGAIAEEFRVEYVVDRVKTTGNVWMGLTMECAQCHSHKYDPISQEEYFKFYAFYNNNADSGMQTRKGNAAPMVEIISPERKASLAKVGEKIAFINSQLEERRSMVNEQFQAWSKKMSGSHENNSSACEPLGLIAHLSFDQFENKTTKDIIRGTFGCVLKGNAKPINQAKFGGGIKIYNNGFLEVKKFGNFEHNQSFSYGAWVKIPRDNLTGAVLGKMDGGNKHRGYDLWLAGGRPGIHLIHEYPDNALKVVAREKIKANQWNHLFVTYNGTGKAGGVKIFVNGKKQGKILHKDSLTKSILTNKPLHIGGRFNSSFVNGAEIDEVRFYERDLGEKEIEMLANVDPVGPILSIPESNRTKPQIEILLTYFLETIDKPYKKIKERKKKAEGELEELEKNRLTSMIMADNPSNQTRKTYLLMRGQYSSPDKSREIFPDTPAFLPPMKEDFPKNRLGLARWLMDKKHPLTARVTVNRYWQTIFGHALVSTPGDFGAQGSWPTHPDLLNWLAADFQNSNWNVKRMIKQLVMSSTYRQSSTIRSIHQKEDPENLYHSRASRFRLMGEFVRDNALSISGLLNRTFGGPGVKTYQPPGLWNEVALRPVVKFVRDNGDKLYRRSMYTYWKRSAPHPGLMAFDAPTREKCTLQRQRTNTPMQSLVTLNDEQFVEAARAFAQRILKSQKNSLADKINWAFELATGHPADSLRQEVLQNAYNHQFKTFNKEPHRARELLAVGESPRDESISRAEHATWTVLASMILNLDETMNRE